MNLNEEWSYSSNFFKAILYRSIVGARAIITSVDGKLKNGIADVDILEEYTFFHDYEVAFETKYLIYDSLKSSNPGTTLGMIQLLEQLSGTKIRGWDITIQGKYDCNTSRYKTLFPHRRSPFQSGQVAFRLKAVDNLIVAIGSDPALATVKLEIVAFQTLLSNAKALQNSQIHSIDLALTALDAEISNCADGLFRVFGGLIKKFFKTPAAVADYFPVELISNRSQTDFKMVLSDVLAHEVFKRKQDILKDKLRGQNNSEYPVELFFTNGIATTPEVGAPKVTMPPQSDAVYNPVAMGYTDAKRHLFARNTGQTEASIQITMV